MRCHSYTRHCAVISHRKVLKKCSVYQYFFSIIAQVGPWIMTTKANCSSHSFTGKDGEVSHVCDPIETEVVNRNITLPFFWNVISNATTESVQVLRGRDKDEQPMRQCAAIVLAGFMLFLVEGIIAVIQHDRTTMIASIVFDASLLLLLTGFTTTRWLSCRK